LAKAPTSPEHATLAMANSKPRWWRVIAIIFMAA
jgi:hypothetical protein